MSDGLVAPAEASIRRAAGMSSETGFDSDTVELAVADVLIERGNESAVEEATSIVQMVVSRFDADPWMRTEPSWKFNLARVPARCGDAHGAAQHARETLRLIEGPFEGRPNPNPFEPDSDPRVVAELRGLAGDDPEGRGLVGEDGPPR
ncbi:MAG TPA: hypothetical protein VNN79_19160 [Actinomycetota bacterium]|nr:hypothetical protein [Actinomycetota bacterium]